MDSKDFREGRQAFMEKAQAAVQGQITRKHARLRASENHFVQAERMFTKVKSRAARRCRSNQLILWKFWIPEEEESMTMKAVVVGLAALGGVAFTAGAASAMPNGLPQADQITGQPAQVEQVRWVCNAWGRCWHRPNWYGAYGYYRPHPYGGWHRWHHWHHWHHWY
jgi:hypothetical protein